VAASTESDLRSRLRNQDTNGRQVLSVSAPSREQLEKQARRFGREGTETFQNSSAATLREEGLSVTEIARSLGITERKVKAQLAA